MFAISSMASKIKMDHILWLLVFFTFQRCGSETWELKDHIPMALETLCPVANICQENKTADVFVIEFKSGIVSCCNVSECSCRLDCDKTGDCCFLVDRHSSSEYSSNNSLEYKKSCLSLIVAMPADYESIGFESYNMITSVRKSELVREKSLTKEECGSQKVAPWGSLFPAYSKSKNRLYKNIVCANLDEASDAVEFDVYIICKRYDPDTLDLNSFVKNGKILNSISNKCEIQFEYQGNINDLNQHLCSNDLKSCSSIFTIRLVDNSHYIEEEISTACRVGTSVSEEMYLNVLCQDCAEALYFNDDWTCSYLQGMSRKNYRYKILIDANFISKLNHRKTRMQGAAPTACRSGHPGECRSLYCPFGQTYDFRGHCEFLSKIWFNPNVQVTINLTSVKPMSQAHFQTIRKDLLTSNFVLRSPWPKPWFTKVIYLLLPAANDEHLSLHVIIINPVLQVRPRVLMRNIKNLIHQKWTLKITNKTLIFASDFSSFNLVSSNIDSHENFINQTKKTFFSQYQEVYNIADIRSTFHPITKMYFCNQIELLADEFTLNSYRHILFNNLTSRYLFWFEFQIVKSINSTKIAKVCVEDSGFEIVFDRSVNLSVDLCAGLFEVLIFILTHSTLI